MSRPKTPETRIQIIQAELGMRTEHIPSLRVPMSPGDVEKALAWAHAARLRETYHGLVGQAMREAPTFEGPGEQQRLIEAMNDKGREVTSFTPSPPVLGEVVLRLTREQVEMVINALIYTGQQYGVDGGCDGNPGTAFAHERLAEQIKEQR